MLFTALKSVWKYRTEIWILVEVVTKLRQTASEFAKEYIRRSFEKSLKAQLILISFEILLFILAMAGQAILSVFWGQLLASMVLWFVTLFNVHELWSVTIPELRAVHRAIRGKTGYALKYFLKVSVTMELLRLNVGFLIFCIGVGITSRTFLGFHFSYFEPWRRLFEP